MLSAKYLALIALVFQNSALILTMRYSRVRVSSDNQYLTSTAVVLSEMIKSFLCLCLHINERCNSSASSSNHSQQTHSARGLSSRFIGLFVDIYGSESGFVKMIFPAALYTFQDNLQFIAASNLDPATHQVMYQGKILTTALFSVILLGKRLSIFKWSTLLILTLGVACVQLPDGDESPGPNSNSSGIGNSYIGILAVAAACMTSGLAGVYFEKVLKSSNARSNSNQGNDGNTSTSQPSLWTRSLQLSTTSFVFAVAHAFIHDGESIRQDGFLRGYSMDRNPAAIAAVCMQATCGLIVAVVIKYADNILKGFATSMSVVLSTVVSTWLFSFVVTRFFLAGASLVMLATWMYGLPDAKVADNGQTQSSKYRDEENFQEEAIEMANGKSRRASSNVGKDKNTDVEHKRED